MLKVRENIAYIPKNIFLFDTTVLENITFSNNFSEMDTNRFEKAIDVANINEFINTLSDDFNSKIGQRGASYQVAKDKELELLGLCIRINQY